VWFILEFYITQILISTTSRFECIRQLIKVTDNNDAWWKLETEGTDSTHFPASNTTYTHSHTHAQQAATSPMDAITSF
jgi:hypothetical protein